MKSVVCAKSQGQVLSAVEASKAVKWAGRWVLRAMNLAYKESLNFLVAPSIFNDGDSPAFTNPVPE